MSKRIINKIQDRINTCNLNGIHAKCIIISKETEREIFTGEELSKADSVENHFKLPVILSTIIKEEIIIGI